MPKTRFHPKTHHFKEKSASLDRFRGSKSKSASIERQEHHAQGSKFRSDFSSNDQSRRKTHFGDKKKPFNLDRKTDQKRSDLPKPSKYTAYDPNRRADLRKKKHHKSENYFSGKPKNFRAVSSAEYSAKLPVEKLSGGNDILWGVHAVRAAWLNPSRKCLRLWLTESGKQTFTETLAEADAHLLKRPSFKLIDRHDLDQMLPYGSVHQGIVLEAVPLEEVDLHDLISSEQPPDILLMLDQVTDPHNIGAILRSAAALGAGAVIMTDRNAPHMTGVLAKSASGAVEHVPQIHVVNLARTIDDLQQAGYWCVGLAEEGRQNLSAVDLTSRVVLVLGAEGNGLRQLTRKKCNELAHLPTQGPIGSLNVSNAAAIALYEIRRQKNQFQQ